MPKNNIDYSNTIIYKINCKDISVKDIYVGHTTNFTQRKYQHKYACIKNVNLKIYNTIRSNGGWENWEMLEIARYNCNNINEAKIKEQKHYVDLKSSLNCIPPIVDKSNYFCKACNLQCENKYAYDIHTQTNKHFKNSTSELYETIKVQESSEILTCALCNYVTRRKSQYNRHLTTDKHISRNFETNLKQLEQKSSESSGHKCICGICFNSRTTLWRHKKVCSFEKNECVEQAPIQQSITPELVMELIKNNKELQQIILEQHTTLNNLVKNGVSNNKTLFPKFREKYPDYENFSSKISDKYDHIVIEAMGGAGNNELEKDNKIIHNISKCVAIDK
jgi:hypothetical protein